jgi:hypothetical protein
MLDLLSCEVCGRPMSFVGALAPDVFVMTCDLCDLNSLADEILAAMSDELRGRCTGGAADVFYYLVSTHDVPSRRAAEAVLSDLFFIVDEVMRGVPTDLIGDRLANRAGLKPKVSD